MPDPGGDGNEAACALGNGDDIGVTLPAPSYEAQQARYRIRTLQLTDNLYVLTSDPADTANLNLYATNPSERPLFTGGNTAVFLTSDGVVLVDIKIPGYGADILAAVRKITDLPLTTIINTHTHWDQAGANPEFSETVNIVTHENTAAPTATATYSSSSRKRARSWLAT